MIALDVALKLSHKLPFAFRKHSCLITLHIQAHASTIPLGGNIMLWNREKLKPILIPFMLADMRFTCINLAQIK